MMDRFEQLASQFRKPLQQHDQRRYDYRNRTILITGASSGIGLYAAKLLATINPNNRIVLACRTQEKADDAKTEVQRLFPQTTDVHIIALACDHTSLASIKTFNTVLRRQLNETFRSEMWTYNGIDVLCLNAAFLAAKDSEAKYTEDGLETTFQTNYLAPFLIINLINDLLNPGARVVLSTSGLHEYTNLSLRGIALDDRRKLQRSRFAMPDGSSFHYKRSYALSKLCGVVLCSELQRRLQHRQITVNCFSPGLMTSSGLFRNQVGDPEAMIHSSEVRDKVKPVGWGAGALVFMVSANEAVSSGGGEYWRDADSKLGWDSVYGEHFCAISISDIVDAATRKQLWNISCQVVGIDEAADFRLVVA